MAIKDHMKDIGNQWANLKEQTEEFEHNVTLKYTKWALIIRHLETVMMNDSITLPKDFKWISADIEKMLSHLEQVKSEFSKMERHISVKDVLAILKIHEEQYEILDLQRAAFSYLNQMTGEMLSSMFQEALLMNRDPAFIEYSDEQVAWYY